MKLDNQIKESWGIYLGGLIGIMLFGYREMLLNSNYELILTSSGLFLFTITNFKFWLFLIGSIIVGFGLQKGIHFLSKK